MKREVYLTMTLWGAIDACEPSMAFARFSPADIRQVDIEHEFTTETYNDKMSYALPLGWRQWWRARDSGLMMSAGSLSQTRFDYQESIKINADTEAPLGVSFTRDKIEDAVEHTLEQELRLSWQVGERTRVALMGDGDGVKEFADLGMAVSQEIASETFVELYYWSVDHYYSLKKPFPSDRRSREPYTAGVKFMSQPTRPTYVLLKAEFDHPLRWHLVSEGFQYEYERRRVDWEFAIAEDFTEGWRASGYAEQKSEGKAWYGGSEAYKQLKRQVWFQDVERFFLWDGRLTSVGMMGVWRHASYQQRHLDRLSIRITNHDYHKSALSERREVGAYVRSRWPVSANGRHFLHGGVYANGVHLAEAETQQRMEAKAQTAWEYFASQKTRIFVNVTWDGDEIAEALAKKRGVRAWGGGNFQVMAVF